MGQSQSMFNLVDGRRNIAGTSEYQSAIGVNSDRMALSNPQAAMQEEDPIFNLARINDPETYFQPR